MPPPNVWGPIFWIFMHNIITLYPDEPTMQDKDNFIIFLNAFRNLLPCKECREHFLFNLNKYPLTSEFLSSKNNLIAWGIGIHNIVRVMLKKTIYYKETEENIGAEKRKHRTIETQKLLGKIMQLSLNEITLNYKYTQKDFENIFNVVNYFMGNDNMEKTLLNKKVRINFDTKNNALKIANVL
jgi:hypothetical protein